MYVYTYTHAYACIHMHTDACIFAKKLSSIEIGALMFSIIASISLFNQNVQHRRDTEHFIKILIFLFSRSVFVHFVFIVSLSLKVQHNRDMEHCNFIVRARFLTQNRIPVNHFLIIFFRLRVQQERDMQHCDTILCYYRFSHIYTHRYTYAYM